MTFPQVASITETTFTTNTTDHNVSMPATVNSGDLLTIVAGFDGQASAPNNPSGWTSQESGAVSNHRRITTARISDGTEGGTTVNVTTVEAEQGAAQVYRITGWFGTLATGLEASAAATGGGTNPAPSSLNPANWATEDTLWIAVAFVGTPPGNTDVSAYPTNFTNGTETDPATASTGALVATARRENAAASEAPDGFTMSAAPQGWGALTIAVRPAAAAGVTLGSRMALMGVGT